MSESDHSEVEFECESSSSSSFDIDKQRFLEEVANAPVEALAPRKPSYTNEEVGSSLGGVPSTGGDGQDGWRLADRRATAPSASGAGDGMGAARQGASDS